MEFQYTSSKVNVRFKRDGLKDIASLLEELSYKKVFVLCSSRTKEEVKAHLDRDSSLSYTFFTKAKMHTPIETTEEALALIQGQNYEAFLAVGGGSVIGLSKALSWRTDIPQIVAPTTYAGSEMTNILGETIKQVKQTQRDDKIQPAYVLYDSALLDSLPAKVAGPSAINALAHSVEALYAENRNPVITTLAKESIWNIAHFLESSLKQEATQKEKDKVLYGAYLAGTCLGSVGMSLHHKVCHALGGAFNLPHADIHCFMLPYNIAYNSSAIPDILQDLGSELAADAIDFIFDLSQKVGHYSTLKHFGLAEKDLEKAADVILSKPYYNPEKVERERILKMLNLAFKGTRPTGKFDDK